MMVYVGERKKNIFLYTWKWEGVKELLVINGSSNLPLGY